MFIPHYLTLTKYCWCHYIEDWHYLKDSFTLVIKKKSLSVCSTLFILLSEFTRIKLLAKFSALEKKRKTKHYTKLQTGNLVGITADFRKVKKQLTKAMKNMRNQRKSKANSERIQTVDKVFKLLLIALLD